MTTPLSGAAKVGVAVLALGAAGCALDAGPRAAPCLTPEVGETTASANARNVLSAVVGARVRNADSVAVRFGKAGSSLDSTAAAVPLGNADTAATVPVLGLLPSSEYVLRVEAYTACGTATGPEVRFTTGALPDDLPSYAASGSDASPGFVVLAAGMYGLVIDNSGRVVWYHRFPTGPGLNFQAQPNGRYVARPNVPKDSIAGWIETDPLGNTTRTMRCAFGMQARPHDMIASPDGSYWLLCDEVRPPSRVRGDEVTTTVTGTNVQHMSSSDQLAYQWSAFDHMDLDLSVLDPADRASIPINWTHGNAIDIDDRGDLYVSFRNLNEIVKIDTRTHTLAWRMGGAHGTLALDDPAPFARQHGLRVVAPGQVLLLDNLGNPALSRAKRYEVDDTRKTARLAAVYHPSVATVARLGGSTEGLSASRTLVSFGNGGRVEEYDAAGNVVWRLEGNPGYVFRAQRIQSLYHPAAPRLGVPSAR